MVLRVARAVGSLPAQARSRGPLPDEVKAFAARVGKKIATGDFDAALELTEVAVAAVQDLISGLERPPGPPPDLRAMSPHDAQKSVEHMLSTTRRPATAGLSTELAHLLAELRSRPSSRAPETLEVARRIDAMVWTIASRVNKARGKVREREDALDIAGSIDGTLSHTAFERAGLCASEGKLDAAMVFLRAGVNNAVQSGLKPDELLAVRDSILGDDPDWAGARKLAPFVQRVAEIFPP